MLWVRGSQPAAGPQLINFDSSECPRNAIIRVSIFSKRLSIYIRGVCMCLYNIFEVCRFTVFMTVLFLYIVLIYFIFLFHFHNGLVMTENSRLRRHHRHRITLVSETYTYYVCVVRECSGYRVLS